MTPEQFLKLPKYAQDEIEKLGRENDSLERQIASIIAPEITPIHWEVTTVKRGIPYNASVVFSVGEHGRKIEVSLRDGGIEIFGSHQLVVVPKVSNSIHVSVK